MVDFSYKTAVLILNSISVTTLGTVTTVGFKNGLLRSSVVGLWIKCSINVLDFFKFSFAFQLTLVVFFLASTTNQI